VGAPGWRHRVAIVFFALLVVAPVSVGSNGKAGAQPADQVPLDPAFVAQLEATLDAGFEASGMPGVIVGLWIPGYGEWVSSRGVSDLETQAPMDRANQAKIGSITKTLVGTVALQVITEGEVGLSLDSTVDEWYPEYPEASQITVRMLMNMSSGVANPGLEQIERICADPYSEITPDEVIAISATTPREAFAPGDGFAYSSFNTFILGRILEETTGAELGELIQQRLLDPLGMDRSRFAPDGQLSAPLVHGYTGFCPELPDPVETTDWYNHESWAGGAMLSTLDDMRTWATALGRPAGISDALLQARVDEAVPVGLDGYTYGLGVEVHRDADTGCVTDLSHGGSEPGYQADVHHFTETGAVFALQGNGDGGTGAAFAEVLLPLLEVMEPVVTPTGTCEPEPPAPTLPPTTPAPAPAAVAAPRFTG
jgi:D-alanyl-D-alanine carboxypeptidase